MTCPTQSKYNVSTIPPFTQQQDSKGEVESLRDELEFQKVLERARKRIAQKEYYTPEEAYKITMQSIREVYAI